MDGSWKPLIGSTVRARLPNCKKRKHRAIVADDDENGQYLLLWEDSFQSTSTGTDLPESWCALQEIEPLQDFEESKTSLEGDFAEQKTRGDHLLSLGDAAAAMCYYEKALQSIPLQIGCTVIIEEAAKSKQASVLKLAEVDCIELDGIDVTMLLTGVEKTIVTDQVALTLPEHDEESLQVRLLLNYARCCLQLAQASMSIKSQFTDRAVHFCSLCILALELRNEDKLSSFILTALLLRSQALAANHRYDAALIDLSTLLAIDPEHVFGQRKVKQYKRQQQEMKRKEKNLVKAMCGYIQQATNGVSTPDDPSEDPPSGRAPFKRVTNINRVYFWVPFLIIIVFAWVLQKQM